jgi:hypothetical protein
LANWIRVDVTYVMSGFLPMYIVSWGPSLRGVVCSCDGCDGCDGCGGCGGCGGSDMDGLKP